MQAEFFDCQIRDQPDDGLLGRRISDVLGQFPIPICLVVDFDAARAHVRTSWNQDCAEIDKLAGSEFVIWHLVLSFRRLAREGAASAAVFVCVGI
jgi:hypothetical protein